MSEIEANTFITQGIDFGMTQLVDGNWGVHGIVPKAIFEEEEEMDGGGEGMVEGTGGDSGAAKLSTVASALLVSVVALVW